MDEICCELSERECNCCRSSVYGLAPYYENCLQDADRDTAAIKLEYTC